MKQFIAASAIAAAALAQFEDAAGSSQCLYCRNQDLNAGYLVSYSYCQHQDLCLKDAWNYISRDCLSTWVRGNTLSLNDCSPELVSCPDFVSSTEKYQLYKNTTWSMAAGSYCVVKVDATAGIARVIFSSTQYLGIEYDAKIDEVITIESGQTDITIYNAADSGPITFGISFSAAYDALHSATLAVAVAGLALLSF